MDQLVLLSTQGELEVLVPLQEFFKLLYPQTFLFLFLSVGLFSNFRLYTKSVYKLTGIDSMHLPLCS